MRSLNEETAVSEIIGTILMLLVATSIFVASFAVVISAPTPPSDIFVDLECSLQDDDITILHKGGESLSLDTEIIITIGNNNPQNFSVDDLLDIALHEFGWNIGEQIVFTANNLNNQLVHVIVRDIELNKLLMDVELNN